MARVNWQNAIWTTARNKKSAAEVLLEGRAPPREAKYTHADAVGNNQGIAEERPSIFTLDT
ncbi:MAG: hypothetical protein R2911_43085 [Caldilineaceae bacterium]